MKEIDKNKLKASLEELINDWDEYPCDYVIIDIDTSEASGEVFENDYYENYDDEFEDELDEQTVEVEDHDYIYVFDKHVIQMNTDDLVEHLEMLLCYRDQAKTVYNKLKQYAQTLVENYEYNHRYYSQIVWNLKERKIQKLYFNNVFDFEERRIETRPSEGVFSLNVDSFIEKKCGYDSEGCEHLEGYFLNENIVRGVVYGAISNYNNLPDKYYGLLFPCELLEW